ncbi:MAG TPA: amino acid adenylation domain-containing protein [Ktedonosporobacter sp.]|jgi:amino acid adenylation domain-containing protein|nr:amino acid adenylation domain-containing protein [Ktedonosporobacter sp.]
MDNVNLLSSIPFSNEKRLLLSYLLEEVKLDIPTDQDLLLARHEAEHLTLSFAQERLWLLDQLISEPALYNTSFVIRMQGLLNRPMLEKSLNEIMRRHEILRTTITVYEGQPRQANTISSPGALPVIDLRGIAGHVLQQQVQQLIKEESGRPFNLTKGALVRVTLLQVATHESLLLLTLHHIISDNQSIHIFFQELGQLYRSYVAGEVALLPALPIQYTDYALWQKRRLQGKVLENLLAYWKRQLAQFPEALILHTDYPRPAAPTFRGATYTFTLPNALTQALKEISVQEQVTLFMTLLAAFQVLLHRYTGQDEFVIGSPVANRALPDTDRLIGLFVNTLVLRANLTGNPTFRDLLRRVRETTLNAYIHQDLPFERLVEALQPKRFLDHNPLFQIMFTLEAALPEKIELPALEMYLHEQSNGTAKFDLTLEFFESSKGLSGRIEYNTDLFKTGTIAQLSGHLQMLLRDIVAHPERRLSDLQLLTPAERQPLTGNRQQQHYSQQQPIHQLFEEQVRQTPLALAVKDENGQLSYQELNKKANQLAHYLQKLGVGPEVPVGLYLHQSREAIVGQLGILKAGGTYIPLDRSSPKERLLFMLKDAGIAVVLTLRCWTEELPAKQLKVICLDSDWRTILQEDEDNPTSGVASTNLAYVIYTSGTTGRPKGVQIEHGSLCNLVAWHREAFALSQLDRATQIANLAFDASLWEIWPYLGAGASIHIPNEETRMTPDLLQQWLLSEAITISFLPTPLAEKMIELEWPRQCALRALLTGGDRLRHYPPSALPFTLINNYGPTEGTVVATSTAVISQQQYRFPSIGTPITGTRIYILDRYLNPVPAGVPGHLYLGGAGIARGYLKQPALTAEKFIPDPFVRTFPDQSGSDGVSEPGARLYKTGDLARYLDSGEIEFIRRVDQQVKLRGFRIELGEIEAALKSHPLVENAIVYMQESDLEEHYLVAYLILAQGQPLASGHLQQYLSDHIPAYMIPHAFVFLEKFPLTANGKVDYKSLPLPEELSARPVSSCIAPRNHLEVTLMDIWCQVLGMKQVGIYDNFFEIGGHSLKATQVISRLRKSLGIELSLRRFFETPTIASLAARIEQVYQQQKERIAATPDQSHVSPGGDIKSGASCLLLNKEGKDAK